jgi:predicted ATPase/DNA-binding winged helix-turn-helix (wHTH) protein
MDPVSEAPVIVELGRFRVLPRRRELHADGQPVKLGGRAFDVLLALIEAHGAVVSKDALMTRVWPNRIVEENNLQAQISALRQALGAERGLIRTVAGRGYQFAGEIRVLSDSPDARAAAGIVASDPLVRPPTNLQESLSDLIGREDELREILSLAATHRLVTLTGVGGIGKTRLALAVARQLLRQFPDGAWLAELAPLSDAALVAGAVAAAVGVDLAGGVVSPNRVAAALAEKELLLVLDNCEHVVDAAATMAELLLRSNPTVHVIATSREPLKLEGEWVFPVPPLAVPTEVAEDDDDPMGYGAVRLCVERARSMDPHFAPDRRGTTVIAAICRRLDGIPLAIELAAPRAAALGIEELAARLDDRFRLLTGGRRTALPRHQTLRATLDWSYGLLAEPERVVLRRLAVFAGTFSLNAASPVVASSDISPPDVIEGLLGLVAKSLVSTTEVSGTVAGYRLLDTMRAYAFEKLGESGEIAVVARRHAEYYRDLAQRAVAEWDTMPTAEWSATYVPSLDNIRAALDWAFAPGGDLSTGVALAVASVPLWVELLLLDECRRRVERAIAGLAVGPGSGTRQEMQLQAALGLSLMYIEGPMPKTGAAWTRALELAVSLDDTDYQLRALWGLWVYRISTGEPRTALALTQRFRSLAESKADTHGADLLIGERMTGVLLHYLGDQTNARACFERMLNRYVAPIRRSLAVRFLFDQHATALVILARVLWLQGFPDRAVGTAQTSIEEARSLNHATSLCYALADAACPIALLTGDLATAERMVEMLLKHSAKHALDIWHACGRCFEGAILVKRGRLDTGVSLLRKALGELRESQFTLRYTTFLGTLAQALGEAGQIGEGLATINEALQRSERYEERWCNAELLRIRGELLLLGDGPDAAAAEDSFLESLDWARRQNALSWELRSATSVARIWREQGRTDVARELLAPIYARFTEGFETSDLNEARTLINDLR